MPTGRIYVDKVFIWKEVPQEKNNCSKTGQSPYKNA